MNTLSMRMSVIGTFGVESHVLERARDAVAALAVALAVRIGHAAVDRDDHFRRRAPRHLRLDRRRVEDVRRVELRTGIVTSVRQYATARVHVSPTGAYGRPCR